MLTSILFVAWTIIGIQVVYWISLYIAFSKDRPSPPAITPAVSIVVCAHDEEKNLRSLIPLLLSQDYPDFEIIVVEDRSNDGTYDFLLEATKLYSKLKMVTVNTLPEHVTGKKFALTLGIKAASSEWVLLTDADCRPFDHQWIRSMARYFQGDKKIVLGYSPYEKRPGYLNSFIRFESLVTAVQFMGFALLHRPYMGTGRNLAYRKSLFLDHKGFNKHLGVMGGDDDLFVNEHATSENTAVSIGQSNLVISTPKKTWREFFFQKLRHLAAGKRYKFLDKLVLGLFSITWVLSWALVLPVAIHPSASLAYLWVGLVLREVLLISVVHRASRALGDNFETWKTPLLDFNYAIYYLGTGLVALVSKRIRWKI